MTQLAIPPGFELIAFSWDQLPTFAAETRRFAVAELALCRRTAQPAAVPVELACVSCDEDAERWDGLS